MQSKNYVLKRLLLATATSVVAFLSPVQANSWRAIDELVTEVEKTGTTVVIGYCQQRNVDGETFDVMGYYQFGGGVDQIKICENNVDMGNAPLVWSVVSHEATHVMQVCYGHGMADTIMKDEFIPEMKAELSVKRPSYLRLIQDYPAAEHKVELEAFWMEFQPEQFVIESVAYFCD